MHATSPSPIRHKPYTATDLTLAIALVALFGWLAIVLPLLISEMLHPPLDLAAMVGALYALLVLGGPVAMVVAVIVVGPLCYLLLQNPVSPLRAMRWGFGTSTALALSYSAYRIYSGWRHSLDPVASSQLGGGDTIRWLDGILNPYGAWTLTVESAKFIALCTLFALAIQRVIGPGRQP